jgi:hypothetical protein
MAWVFALNAECGPAGDDASRVLRHFQSWPASSWRCTALTDMLGNWWCTIAPVGLSESGVRSPSDAAAMTAEGNRLYECLRSAPPAYRYALTGVETDQFWLFNELVDDVELTWLPGLVLADQLWETAGCPDTFEEFAPGYRWIPYRGESHTST